MTYRLHRELYGPALRAVHLASRRELAPGLMRLRLQADRPREFEGFRAPGAGDHVRVLVAETPQGALPAITGDALPAGAARVETVVAHDEVAGWLDLDIVHHGPAGRIGPWAAHAPLGAPAVVADPKGSVLMAGRPRRWVLAGDDTAIPAIRRYLGMLGPSGTGTLLLETRHNPGALELDVPAGVELSILTPQAGRPSGALVDAMADLDVAPGEATDGELFLFACGEQSIVAPARGWLARWGIDVEQAVVKGYWKDSDARRR